MRWNSILKIIPATNYIMRCNIIDMHNMWSVAPKNSLTLCQVSSYLYAQKKKGNFICKQNVLQPMQISRQQGTYACTHARSFIYNIWTRTSRSRLCVISHALCVRQTDAFGSKIDTTQLKTSIKWKWRRKKRHTARTQLSYYWQSIKRIWLPTDSFQWFVVILFVSSHMWNV